MLKKVLIANRGDSACRVHRTCRRLGIASATVHSSADRTAAHVLSIGESIEIGAPAAAESYLNIPAIIAAAKQAGADAVHPGIGFLSETAAFAAAVEDADLIFVGPSADTLDRFGDKMQAKREAQAVHIPVIAGAASASGDPDAIAAMVAEMTPPVLLKAAGGGGGRGMRVLHNTDDMTPAIASAMREAKAAFGRPDLLVEQYLARVRHVEVQVAGDGTGAVLHLFDRDCSPQRRHQKVIEEAPAVDLPADLRAEILAAACRLAAHARLRGLATVEFLVAGEQYYFLEVNPRLQVEHSVTEMVTGLDLVEWQLRIAAGQPLPCRQDQVRLNGHAMQARLYAEDPENGFTPASGVVRHLTLPPPPVRVDLGVRAGEAVGSLYDPMVGKLAVHGADRAQAVTGLAAALDETAILGLPTNLDFLRRLLAQPEMAAGVVDTAFIDREVMPRPTAKAAPTAELFAIAGALWLRHFRQGPATDPWAGAAGFTSWRLGSGTVSAARKPVMIVEIDGDAAEIGFSAGADVGATLVRVDDREMAVHLEQLGDQRLAVSAGNVTQVISAMHDGDSIYLSGAFGNVTATVSRYAGRAGKSTGAGEDRVLAPVMGQVAKVLAKVGDKVKAGDILIIQDSMKMELHLTAPHAGVVTALSCAEGDMLARHQFVAEVRAMEDALQINEREGTTNER